MPSRRDFIKLAVGGSAALAAAGLGCGRDERKRHEAPKDIVTGPPRYYVLLLLSGGHDTVYTTDPKIRSEVRADIDLPTENKIAEAAKLRLGPHLAGLAPYADRMALVNGVQVGTANHDTGLKQFFRLKTNIADRMPTAFDIIGQTRDGQPLGAIYLNISHRVLHSPGYVGYADRFYFGQDTIFDAMNQADSGELARLAKVMRKEAASIGRRGAPSREARATILHLEEVAALFDKVAALPPFYPAQVASDYTSQSMAEGLQRAAWIIEHDLSRTVLIDLGLLGWDTHQRNAARQGEMTQNFVTHFTDFMTTLERRKNARGSLAAQTLVVGGSDMGRFPRLNDMLGKDHLPQTSFFFIGAGIAGGRVFGQTGKEMEALPVSMSTGAHAADGRQLFLDDVGTTLIKLAGLDPEIYGYSGQVMDFLLA